MVDHVDTFIGNGFALDSSSTPGGVSIMWVGNSHGLYGSDWYRQHFVWGRHILPALTFSRRSIGPTSLALHR